MKPKDVVKKMLRAGWKFKAARGAHFQYVHPDHPEKGKVTVSMHDADMLRETLARIQKQTGLKF